MTTISDFGSSLTSIRSRLKDTYTYEEREKEAKQEGDRDVVKISSQRLSKKINKNGLVNL